MDRELTGREKRQICSAAKEMCANYDDEYGCLPLDSGCYMFNIAYTNSSLCKYFKKAVLPMYSNLDVLFSGGIRSDTKDCHICRKSFVPNGKQIYCSDSCKHTGDKRKTAARVKKHRKIKEANVTIRQ